MTTHTSTEIGVSDRSLDAKLLIFYFKNYMVFDDQTHEKEILKTLLDRGASPHGFYNPNPDPKFYTVSPILILDPSIFQNI